MKKFDIKWLLILVLVVVLAFGLVACNKDKGNTTPDEPEEQGGGEGGGGSGGKEKSLNQAVFFTELWKASKSIGATDVNPDEDKIKIAIEGDMEYASEKVAAGSTDIGMEMGIVLDLPAANANTPSLGDTALKLKFYDKTDAHNKNWFTVWYFFNDASKIYFQVKEEYFVLQFDAYWNAQFTTLLGELVNNDEIFATFNNMTPFNSIMDVVNHIAETGGPTWTLDDLIIGKKEGGKTTSLLGLFGLNLTDLLSNQLVASALSIDVSQGIPSLEDVLKTAAAMVVKKVTKDVKGTVTYYTAKGIGAAKSIVNPIVDNLFNSYDIALSFGTDGTKFVDGFTIEVFGATKNNANTSLKIHITKFEITKETAVATTALAKPSTGFKSNVEFSVEGEMNLDNNVVVINPNDVAIGFGTYSIKFAGSVDLVGAAAENKTAAQLQIISGKLTGGTPMLTATYKNNTLSILVDPTNAQAAAIMKAGLPSLAKAIKDASTGTNAEVPFALFTTMADDVLEKAFTNNTYATVDTSFKGITVTGVDIATLAKGAFYAIFQNVATHIDEEKNIGAVADLETYEGDIYQIGTKYYKDSQYSWKPNILSVVDAVIGAISYNGTSKDYTLGFDNISSLLLSIFKDGSIQAYKDAACATADGNAVPVAKPADVKEMMALFMCTNDGLIKELTNHGILPLYKDGITTKFLSKTYTPADAAAEGYYYISGKMVSKTDALAIWNYICSNGSKKLNALGNKGTYNYFNCDKDPNKEEEPDFLANSLIQWFFNFIDGSSVLDVDVANPTPTDYITKLAGAGSRIAIDLNKDTGYFGAHITLNGKTCEGTFKYDFTGTDTAYVPTMSAALGDDPDKYTVVELDDDFYTLFKAAYGMGFGTSVQSEHGKNKSIYYVAAVETNVSGDVLGYALDADHKVCVITSATECKLYANGGVIDATYTLTNNNKTLTIAGATPAEINGAYTVYGDALKLVQKD